MQITILEDNLFHLTRLEGIVQDVCKELRIRPQIYAISTAEEFRELDNQHEGQELYFFDLQLQKQNLEGLELAKQVRKHYPCAMIVIVSSYGEYMPLVFQHLIQALDFIPKELGEMDFYQRVAQSIRRTKELSQGSSENVFHYHPKGTEGIDMDYRDILWIETLPNSHYLQLIGETSNHLFYGSLSEIIKQDRWQHFQQVSRSAIVNLENVLHYNPHQREVIFYDNRTYPVSRNWVSRVKTAVKESNNRS